MAKQSYFHFGTNQITSFSLARNILFLPQVLLKQAKQWIGELKLGTKPRWDMALFLYGSPGFTTASSLHAQGYLTALHLRRSELNTCSLQNVWNTKPLTHWVILLLFLFKLFQSEISIGTMREKHSVSSCNVQSQEAWQKQVLYKAWDLTDWL